MKINKEKVLQAFKNCKSLEEVMSLTGYTETQLYNLAHRDKKFYKPFYDLRATKVPKKTKEVRKLFSDLNRL